MKYLLHTVARSVLLTGIIILFVRGSQALPVGLLMGVGFCCLTLPVVHYDRHAPQWMRQVLGGFHDYVSLAVIMVMMALAMESLSDQTTTGQWAITTMLALAFHDGHRLKQPKLHKS